MKELDFSDSNVKRWAHVYDTYEDMGICLKQPRTAPKGIILLVQQYLATERAKDYAEKSEKKCQKGLTRWPLS